MSETILQTHSEPAFLLQNIAGILTNLEKAILVYRQGKSQSIALMMISADEANPVNMEVSAEFNYYALERFCNQKTKTEWIDEQNLPLNSRMQTSISRDVFSEIKNSVLVIRIKNRMSGLNDVFMLFFNLDASNFGPVRNTEILNTSSKSIIEYLVYNQILHFKKLYSEQLKQFSQYKKFLERIRDKAKYQSTQITVNQQQISKIRINFAEYILKKLRDKYHLEIALSNEALATVSKYEGSFEQMDTWISDAFEFARFTEYNPNQLVLVLDEWHFSETIQKQPEQEEDKKQVEARHLKAYSLLDRLEMAAMKVAGSKLKLTSSAVGQAMETPISAPAISDALKKNSKKIQQLLLQFPERWMLIRSEFRPLLNVKNSISNQYNQKAS